MTGMLRAAVTQLVRLSTGSGLSSSSVLLRLLRSGQLPLQLCRQARVAQAHVLERVCLQLSLPILYATLGWTCTCQPCR